MVELGWVGFGWVGRTWPPVSIIDLCGLTQKQHLGVIFLVGVELLFFPLHRKVCQVGADDSFGADGGCFWDDTT